MLAIKSRIKKEITRLPSPLITLSCLVNIRSASTICRNSREKYRVAIVLKTIAFLGQTMASRGETMASLDQTMASRGETIASLGETIASLGETMASLGETMASLIKKARFGLKK